MAVKRIDNTAGRVDSVSTRLGRRLELDRGGL